MITYVEKKIINFSLHGVLVTLGLGVGSFNPDAVQTKLQISTAAAFTLRHWLRIDNVPTWNFISNGWRFSSLENIESYLKDSESAEELMAKIFDLCGLTV